MSGRTKRKREMRGAALARRREMRLGDFLFFLACSWEEGGGAGVWEVAESGLEGGLKGGVEGGVEAGVWAGGGEGGAGVWQEGDRRLRRRALSCPTYSSTLPCWRTLELGRRSRWPPSWHS